MNFRNFLRWVGAFVFTMGIVTLMVYVAYAGLSLNPY